MIPIFGINKEGYAALPSDAFRSYNPPKVGMPTTWPGPDGGPIPATTRYPVVSIRPDITQVNSGSLDGAIKAFAKTIPEGAVIAPWHEGDAARFKFIPGDFLQMHHRLRTLIKSVQPRCVYMQIVEGYTARHGMLAPFISPDVDMYGIDGYPELTSDTPGDVFGPAVKLLRGSKDICITETNATGAFGKLPDNKHWYYASWRYARHIGSPLYMVYTNPDVPIGADSLQALKTIQGYSQTLGLLSDLV